MADYLLYHLNQTENFAYVSLLKLDEPMDDIRLVLAKSAIYQGLLAKRRNLETGEWTTIESRVYSRLVALRFFRSASKLPGY